MHECCVHCKRLVLMCRTSTSRCVTDDDDDDDGIDVEIQNCAYICMYYLALHDQKNSNSYECSDKTESKR